MEIKNKINATRIINNFLNRYFLFLKGFSTSLQENIDKINNINISYNSLEKDLVTLSSAENLAIGFGTFGFLIYLINPYLKNLYIPRYCLDELPKGSWGDDIKLSIIDLPNYIKVGKWINTIEQRKILCEYCIYNSER